MTARFRWLQRGLLIVGAVLIAVWSEDYLEARDFQSRGSRRLAVSRREHEAASLGAASSDASFTSRRRHAIETGGVLGRIEIPRLGIAAIVAEGTDDGTLRHAVGHVAWTALPGGAGNCALAGHRDTFFRGLGGVRGHDVIRIVTRERTYLYRVDWTEVVAPRRVDVLDSTATRSLTLVTCYPFVYVGHAPKRFVVRASAIGADDRPWSAGGGETK